VKDGRQDEFAPGSDVDRGAHGTMPPPRKIDLSGVGTLECRGARTKGGGPV